jgi:hypothetical protein
MPCGSTTFRRSTSSSTSLGTSIWNTLRGYRGQLVGLLGWGLPLVGCSKCSPLPLDESPHCTAAVFRDPGNR